MAELTPFDTGVRLEPQPWQPLLAEPQDWGKVDYDNDESNTVFTIWVENQQGEYVVHIDCHHGEAPTVDFEGLDE